MTSCACVQQQQQQQQMRCPSDNRLDDETFFVFRLKVLYRFRESRVVMSRLVVGRRLMWTSPQTAAAAAPAARPSGQNDHARSVMKGGAPPRRGFITSFDSGAKGVIASGIVVIALQLLHSNGRNEKKLFARRH